ncbi:MAG: hypothetical protein E6Q76_12910 [Rhizobium sp.]|nr:MAG: hypothetical protein E6Q76_12910 [Rhizobium sp.]
MGTTCAYISRPQLEKEITEGWRNGRSEVICLKHKWVTFNRLWVVYERIDQPLEPDEAPLVQRFAMVVLCRPFREGTSRGWCYKEISEDCGPNAVDFPMSWLPLLTGPSGLYSEGWRQRVREYHARRGTGQRLRIGQVVNVHLGNGSVDKATLLQLKPLRCDIAGITYRLRRSQIAFA